MNKRGTRLSVILCVPGRKDRGRHAAENGRSFVEAYDVLGCLAVLMKQGMHAY